MARFSDWLEQTLEMTIRLITQNGDIERIARLELATSSLED